MDHSVTANGSPEITLKNSAAGAKTLNKEIVRDVYIIGTMKATAECEAAAEIAFRVLRLMELEPALGTPGGWLSALLEDRFARNPVIDE